MIRNFMVLIGLVFSLTLFVGHSFAAGLEKIQFLKIAPQEQKAVVKMPDGKLQLVGVGQELVPNIKIIEIAEGRVVLEEAGEHGPETVIVRLDGKFQRIERLRQQGEPPPAMVAPAEVKGGAEKGKPGFQ
jgi:hypothetical protein